MSFGGGGDNKAAVEEQKKAAEEAKQKERERQARLDQGTRRINSAFDGKWQDTFLRNYEDAHNDYYLPQVADQFGEAQQDLTFSLARAGLTRSTAATDEQASLLQQRLEQEAAIRSQGDQQTAGIKSDITNAKQNAINQLYATEDPDIGANSALDNIRTIQSRQPSYSPLGDLFSVAQIGANNYAKAQADRKYYNTVTGGNGNSSYVVN